MMKVTDFTRSRLKQRRERRALVAAGYEEVGADGGPLWELQRGARRLGHVITDVKIAPEGRTVFVKIATDQVTAPATAKRETSA